MAERREGEDSHDEEEQTIGLRAPSRDSQTRVGRGIRTPNPRDTTESGVSPSLSDLVRSGAEASSKSVVKPKKKKKGKGKSTVDKEDSDDGSEGLSSVQDSRDDRIAQLMSLTLELQGQIKRMQQEKGESMLNSSSENKSYRRGSIALTSKTSANNVVRALVPVSEEEKMKKATVYSIIELQSKLNEQQNQGIPISIINYMSKSVLQKMLLWLSLGNAQEAGLQGYDFTTVEDLNQLTDSDIESILILMIRPNERGMLIRLMKDIRVFVTKNNVNVNRPLYLNLKSTFQAVLEYLHTYEKIYKMMSGEMGLPVNGVMIGENVNTCIETMSKTQSDVKNPDNHEAILKLTLVHGDILPMRLYNLIKGDPARGPAALVRKTAEMIENIHPRKTESNKSIRPAAKSTAKKDTHHFHTHLCRYPDVKVEFGKVLLETMRHNLNIAASVHDGVIQPFLAMMMPEVGTPKADRTVNMLGHILTMEEGCDERDNLIETLETTGDDGEHVKHCCFLQDELVKAQEAARVSELKCQELTAAEHSRIFNMVQNGSTPVKIPTGFQNQHNQNPKSILQRPNKPCFAEARLKGSCKRGSGCRYSHLEKDLEELRRNPVAANNLHVLGQLEDIPEAYDAAADSFSEQY